MVTDPIETVATFVTDDETPSVDWSAIIGAVVISAASLSILTAFGAAIGFASVSPWTSNPSSTTLVVGAAAWFALTALYAGAVGGYIAGRLRKPTALLTPEGRTAQDGMHGLITWAGMLLSGLLTAYVFTATVNNKAADLSAQTAGPALAEAVKGASDKAGNFASYYVDRALRPGTTNAPNANPADDIRPELARLLTRSLTGNLSDDDSAYLARIIAQRTGISEADAKTRVDQMVNDAHSAYEKAVDQAKVAAERARKVAIKSTTWFAIVALLAAVLSWFAAVIGGHHRDETL